MSIHREGWSEFEQTEGESYGVTCTSMITTCVKQALGDLRTLEVLLPEDKRAAIEMAAVLECAALLAKQQLQELDADDFALTAFHVFMHH